MFDGLRKKLRESPRLGVGIAIAAVVLGVGVLVYGIRSTFGPSTAARHNAERVYICAETGKTFAHTVKPGTKIQPVRSPYSGKDTGYPAQLCFWTADGHVKKDPTYVLMNSDRGIKGPTFCPECNRLVPANNPVVAEGATPPPTKDEYTKRRSGKRNAARDDDEGDQ